MIITDNILTGLLSTCDWLSLIECLKSSSQFKCKVKSHPDDEPRFVYELSFDKREFIEEWCNRIVFSIRGEDIHVEVMARNDKKIDKFLVVLFREPLKNMPLHINDENSVIKNVAQWRLRRGK